MQQRPYNADRCSNLHSSQRSRVVVPRCTNSSAILQFSRWQRIICPGRMFSAANLFHTMPFHPHPRYPAHSHRTTSCWCWFVSLLHMHTWAIAVAKHSAAEWGKQQSTTAASSTCTRPSTQSNTKYTDVSENVLELSKLLRTRLSNRRSPGKKAICHRPVEKGAPRMGKWPGAFGVSGSLFWYFSLKVITATHSRLRIKIYTVPEIVSLVIIFHKKNLKFQNFMKIRTITFKISEHHS